MASGTFRSQRVELCFHSPAFVRYDWRREIESPGKTATDTGPERYVAIGLEAVDFFAASSEAGRVPVRVASAIRKGRKK